jgi:hypothetical protein
MDLKISRVLDDLDNWKPTAEEKKYVCPVILEGEDSLVTLVYASGQQDKIVKIHPKIVQKIEYLGFSVEDKNFVFVSADELKSIYQKYTDYERISTQLSFSELESLHKSAALQALSKSANTLVVQRYPSCVANFFIQKPGELIKIHDLDCKSAEDVMIQAFIHADYKLEPIWSKTGSNFFSYFLKYSGEIFEVVTSFARISNVQWSSISKILKVDTKHFIELTPGAKTLAAGQVSLMQALNFCSQPMDAQTRVALIYDELMFNPKPGSLSCLLKVNTSGYESGLTLDSLILHIKLMDPTHIVGCFRQASSAKHWCTTLDNQLTIPCSWVVKETV